MVSEAVPRHDWAPLHAGFGYDWGFTNLKEENEQGGPWHEANAQSSPWSLIRIWRKNKVRGIMQAGAQRGVKESSELGSQRRWDGSRR